MKNNPLVFHYLFLLQTIQAIAVAFLVGSLFYCFGRFMRKVFWPVGMVLTGFFGRMILFVVWIFSALLCLLCAFWIYIAKIHRNEGNSSFEDDPNYCAPVIWYSAQTTVALFAIFSAITAVATIGEFYYFLLGPEVHSKAVVHTGVINTPSRG